SPFIEQIMVMGAGEKFVSALIVPNFISVRNKLKNEGMELPDTNSGLIQVEAVEKLIRSQLDRYNTFFGHWEQVKKFTLLPSEWTVDNGALTPKLSLRRKIIEQQYRSEIEEIYR